MRRTLLLQIPESYTLVWEDGVVSIEDMDVLDEFIALTLANIQPPFSLLILEELIKEMQGLREGVYLRAINEFQRVIHWEDMELARYLKVSKPFQKALRLYATTKLGNRALLSDQGLTLRAQEWFVSLQDPDEFEESVIISLARSKRTHKRTLEKLATSPHLESLPVQIALLQNSYTPSAIKALIFDKHIGSSFSALQMRMIFVDTWLGPLPDVIAFSLITGDNQGYLKNRVCQMQISEEVQIFLAQEVMATNQPQELAYLLRNRHLSNKVRALLAANGVGGVEV